MLVLVIENMENPVQPAYRVPLHSRIARVVFKPVLRGLLYLRARVTVTGKENVPFGQPYLVTFNHISIFDPAFAVALWPEMIEILGASDVWEKPGQGQLAWLYHGIKVHRGEYDRAVFEKALSVLEAGYPLLMSPEGGRSHITALRRAKPGLAFIIERANVPVLPVGIVGTTDDVFIPALLGQRPVLAMHISQAMPLAPLEEP